MSATTIAQGVFYSSVFTALAGILLLTILLGIVGDREPWKKEPAAVTVLSKIAMVLMFAGSITMILVFMAVIVLEVF
jgi:hypothetical protein